MIVLLYIFILIVKTADFSIALKARRLFRTHLYPFFDIVNISRCLIPDSPTNIR